jgi:hypothetical protein
MYLRQIRGKGKLRTESEMIIGNEVAGVLELHIWLLLHGAAAKHKDNSDILKILAGYH